MKYYIYYSQQKVMQLFKQLPESRCVGLKIGSSSNNHGDLDFRPGEQDEACPRLTHFSQHTSSGGYRESHFDPNEMYQLRRVLQALRRAGQLRKAMPGMCTAPGVYLEFSGCFSPQQDEPAPEGAIWLASPKSSTCPAVRLLCCKLAFSGDNVDYALQELWCCGGALPLHGVMLCMSCGNTLCGLPLYLAL